MKKLLPFLAALLILPSTASAADIHVGPGQAFSTIQAAVNAASPGDIIKVHTGTYHETVTITKSGLTVEAYDPKYPPEIDGADQGFANSAHSWVHVEGKIYKTSYDLPFKHLNDTMFTSRPTGTGLSGDPIMTLYEDDVWLRGYWGGEWYQLSRPYDKLTDLDASKDAFGYNYAQRDVRVQGRFMYDDELNELYVWTAEEHGEDHPSNHDYHIPVLRNLVIINAPGVTLRNLVLKHSYYYALLISDSGDGAAIENCYIVNTGPFSILSENAEGVRIEDNFIQIKGFYERQDYISVRHNILKGILIHVKGLAQAKNCEISRNVVSGTYGIMAHGQDCRVHDNIISHSQSILVFPQIESVGVPPSDYIHNVSIYHNILHHADFSAFTSYNTLQQDYNKYYGPVWIFRNVIYDVPYINKEGCDHSHCDPTPDTFIYHNTFVFSKGTADNSYDYPVHKSTVYRNNIVHFRQGSMEMYWSYTSDDFTLDRGWYYFPFDNGPDTDYNLYWRESEWGWDQIARFWYYYWDGEKWARDPGSKTYYAGQFSMMQDQTGQDPHSIEANPKFVNGEEFSNADVVENNHDTQYDDFSIMNYRDVITQGYSYLYNLHFPAIYSYFNVDPDTSPAIDAGETLPSGWPDTVTVADGQPDIGAAEYGGLSLQTCSEKGGLDCCTGDETCPGTDLGPSSDCSGVCCSQQCQPPPQELVAYWTFDSQDISGSTALDVSGSDNHGTISGASQATGRVGEALHFDGTGHVGVPDSASMDFGKSGGTIMMWVMPETLTDRTWHILAIDTDFEMEFNIANSRMYIYPYVDDGPFSNYNMAEQLIEEGRWQHLAASWDYPSKQARLYIDGQEQALVVENVPTYWDALASTADWQFGGTTIKQNENFTGKMDDVRIYSYALTPAEVLDLYESSFHEADISPKDGCIEDDELVDFIYLWKIDSTVTPMPRLMEAVGLWKKGTGCVS